MPTWNDLFLEEAYRWREPNELVQELAALWLAQREGWRVLDLGCGAGRHVVYLRRLGFVVDGVDVAPNGLRYARQWLSEEGLQAALTRADMTALPYASRQYDLIIALYAIHHNPLQQVRRTLGEMWRILRPMGQALLTVPSTRTFRYGAGTELEYHTYIPGVGADGEVPHHYFDLEELALELRPWVVRRVQLVEDEIAGQGLSSHWAVWLEKA